MPDPHEQIDRLEDDHRGMFLTMARSLTSIEACTEAMRAMLTSHEKLLESHSSLFDGIGDKPGIRTRIAVLEDFAYRQRWFTGLVFVGIIGLLVRLIVL